MIKHTLFAVSIGLVLFFLYLLQHTGAFKSVAIGTDERGPYTLIYLEHTGAYHKIVDKIIQVETWAKDNSLNCRFTFGEFFDNPNVAEEGRLKSRGGCLIDSTQVEDVLGFKKATLPEGFKITELPKRKTIVALFNGSPGIGPFKVYPKVEDFMLERKLVGNGAVVEIYEVLDAKNMNTTYLFPVQ